MRLTVVVITFLCFFSCSSDKEVKKMTDKGLEIVVQKFIDEYNQEFELLTEELNDSETKYQLNKNDSIAYFTYEEATKKYKAFVSSELMLKKINSALEKKEALKEEQITSLKIMQSRSKN